VGLGGVELAVLFNQYSILSWKMCCLCISGYWRLCSQTPPGVWLWTPLGDFRVADLLSPPTPKTLARPLLVGKLISLNVVTTRVQSPY